MGISGLIPFVKNACRPGKIYELRGKSVALDVSCLLHRGLTGCMDKIHMGETTQSYIYYVEKYIKELIALDCHVVMVFDGRQLPAKKQTNDGRKEQRERNMESAELLLSQGMEKEAREIFRTSTTIRPEFVEETIRHFRTWTNVDVVVAPYEADAQLAYLMKAKLVDAVITEDSDLIVFGCETIYFKWQSGSGDCMVYEKPNLKKCFSGELGGDKFDFVKFRRICILSGCDYLPAGLPGVGLSTAVKFFAKTSIKELRPLLKKVPSYLNNPKLKAHITEEFITNFEKAENTFMYQVVFDPKERCQKPLNPYPLTEVINIDKDLDTPSSQSSIKSYDYAGTVSAQRISIRLALGNPSQGSSIDDKFLLKHPNPKWSVWDYEYESRGTIKGRQEKAKLYEAMQCGPAFKLDSPTVKKVKIDSSKQKKSHMPFDDEDDLVKQFIQDVEKEKNTTKKRKNAPDDDSSAEMLMAKYSVKKLKIEEKPSMIVLDDFEELFDEREKIDEQRKKDSVTKKKVDGEKKKEVEQKKEVTPEPDIRPVPMVRKVVSSPADVTTVQWHKKPFSSPILHSHNSSPAPSTTVTAEKTPVVVRSKYFNKNTDASKPRVTNPFRCPAFVKPTPPPSEKVETKKENKSVLSCLEDPVMPESSNNYSFVGFKSSGLKRKSSK